MSGTDMEASETVGDEWERQEEKGGGTDEWEARQTAGDERLMEESDECETDCRR